jgi:radical SAM superfamily enzyme YgiQ (UPF0313 family)
MLKPINPLIPPSKHLLSREKITERSPAISAFPTQRVSVCLVNLTARGYAGKQQPPAAVQTLAAYLMATTRADVRVADMQAHLITLNREILEGKRGYLTLDERFELAAQMVIDEVKELSPHILGLSMKWGTLKPAAAIVRACREDVNLKDSLIVVGNSISTFGSDELLAQEPFKGVLAVLGEGEEALKSIIEIASDRTANCADRNLYRGVPNVKTEPQEKIIRKNLDLDAYPVLTNEGLFGEGMLWAAVEASRGCAWGFCRFCSIGELYAAPEWRPLPTELVLDRIERFVRAGHHWIGLTDSDVLGTSLPRISEADFDWRIERMRTIARGIKDLNEHYAQYGVISGPDDAIRLARLSVRVDSVYRTGEAERNVKRKQLYALLKEEGRVTDVYLGIEAASQRRLNRFGKGVRFPEIKEAVKILRGLGIRIQPGFMALDPEEEIGEARKDMSFLFTDRHFSDGDVCGSLRAQAGSRLTDDLGRKGLLTGEFDLDTVSYPIAWGKSAVGEIKEVFEKVASITKELIDYLGYMDDNSFSISHLLSNLRYGNTCFLKWLLLSKANPASRQKDLVIRLRGIYRDALKPLEDSLRSGLLKDPTLENEILPAAIKQVEELLAQLGASVEAIPV